jgi:hypothetical protein
MGLIEEHNASLRAWEKSQACRWPDCQCQDAHRIVQEIASLAARVGHTFTAHKDRLACTSFCKACRHGYQNWRVCSTCNSD